MRSLRLGTRLGALLAIPALVWASPVPTPVEYSPSQCLTGPMRPQEQRVEGTVVLVPVCGGGIGGSVAGNAISMGKASMKIPAADYGEPGAGNAVKSKITPTNMQKFVEDNKVPWPCKNCKKAQDMDEYEVYHIWGKDADGKTQGWKYGITKKGEMRPQSQIKTCEQTLIKCKWKMVRVGVPGWRTARKWEAHHAARYKAEFGKCPPGMTRCL